MRQMVNTIGELREAIGNLPDDTKIAVWRNGTLVELGDTMGVDRLRIHKRDKSFMSTDSLVKHDKTLRRMQDDMDDAGEVFVIG